MADKKVVIVGAGSAGLTCALTLLDAGVDFRIVSETLGGRICYNAEEKVNFGAYFIMANYRRAKRLVRRETWINPLNVVFHNSAEQYFSTLSLHSLRRLPGLLRFARVMRRFYKHYEPYKERCTVVPQEQALREDPYMGRLFAQTAESFVRENRLEAVAHDYLSKFSYACTGVRMDRLTALDFLNVCLGITLPIHRFSFDEPAMERTLGGRLVRDSVTAVERAGQGWRLVTGRGSVLEADTLVLATPAAVTQRLTGRPDKIRQTCQLYVYHVHAKLKPKFATHEMNVFPFESEIIFTARQDDGSYLVYTREEDEGLLRDVCAEYSLISMKAWQKAMYVFGEGYMEQTPEPGLLIAGDHNGLGLEPTAVSGVFAANRILGRA
jgi:hypothetical protein